MSKSKFSKYWPPGIGMLLTFVVGFIILILIGTHPVTATIVIVIAIVLETWMYKRRKRFIESGECLPSHPFIKTALVFNLIAIALIMIWAIAARNAVHGNLDGTTWTYFIGFAWNAVTFSLLAVIYSLFSFVRSAKDKKTNKLHAIIPFLTGLLLLWVNFTFVFPVIDDLNEGLINNSRSWELENFEK